jgi:hypothetical protein
LRSANIRAEQQDGWRRPPPNTDLLCIRGTLMYSSTSPQPSGTGFSQCPGS